MFVLKLTSLSPYVEHSIRLPIDFLLLLELPKFSSKGPYRLNPKLLLTHSCRLLTFPTSRTSVSPFLLLFMPYPSPISALPLYGFFPYDPFLNKPPNIFPRYRGSNFINLLRIDPHPILATLQELSSYPPLHFQGIHTPTSQPRIKDFDSQFFSSLQYLNSLLLANCVSYPCRLPSGI
ncbi:177aa long hypothetical protein [Pyrococcus horikoshii OT3]|uniref:Uncharacterized protein n=1 Tax=Pyrococcus horikoshii (strain ATCC 700860 / DSM 12428 / JCM 9974 / NBRC 100139 / OT-3) TaxID=70601 RepID=O59436_PYRHO|nr:177aa long hypothetical protein [Pyrococcus horikoshii OT3]